MDPHSKYVKAERALDAISSLSCSVKTLASRGDDSLCRAASTKSILRLERYLSPTSIDPHLKSFQPVFPTTDCLFEASFATEGV